MKLICYLSNGYPTIEASARMAEHYVEAGCDCIEMDFPARDPYLEGPYIADRMRVALEACDDYRVYMDGMAKIKAALPQTQFILLAYAATVLEIGYDTFVTFCRAQGFTDMILVGQTDDTLQNRLMADGMGVSCYVQYHLPPEEVAAACTANGFVYMQGKPAADQPVNPACPTLKDCIAYLRQQGIDRPIYCGVGIHTPEDAEMAKAAGADGIFVGRAVLQLHDQLPRMMTQIQAFKAVC